MVGTRIDCATVDVADGVIVPERPPDNEDVSTGEPPDGDDALTGKHLSKNKLSGTPACLSASKMS